MATTDRLDDFALNSAEIIVAPVLFKYLLILITLHTHYSLFTLRGLNIFNLQLDLSALVDVVLDGIDDIERTFRLDIACRTALAEGNTIEYVARLGVDQFELDMLLLATHYLRGAVVVHITCAEQWLGVVGTMRGKLLQVVVQFLGDLLEVDHGIDIEGSLCLFGLDMFHHVLLETAAELGDILDLHGETDGIGMAAEVLQQVATTLDGIVEIIAGHTAGGTRSQTIMLGENHGRTVK